MIMTVMVRVRGVHLISEPWVKDDEDDDEDVVYGAPATVQFNTNLLQ